MDDGTLGGVKGAVWQIRGTWARCVPCIWTGGSRTAVPMMVLEA